MYSEVDSKGDEGYIAEDLLAGTPGLESRCQAIDQAVRKGYFSIAEALPLYEVTESQYIAYNLLRNNNMQSADKQLQLLESLRILFKIYEPVTSTFTGHQRSIMDELKEIVQ